LRKDVRLRRYHPTVAGAGEISGVGTAVDGGDELIEFILDGRTALLDGSSGEADVEGRTNDEEGDGECDAGTQEPRRLLTSLTLEQTEEVEVLGLFDEAFQSFLLWSQAGLLGLSGFVGGGDFGRRCL